jgi:putative NADH-flavin reductase
MKIALIGATGKAGQHVLQSLLQQQYEIVWGKYDARNYEDLQSLLTGCDALISTLGGSPIHSLVTSHLLKVLGSRRYIALTGLSIDVPGDEKSEWVAAASAWTRQHYPAIIADKQEEYRLLSTSKLNWTLVRVPFIEPAAPPTGFTLNLRDCPGQKIAGADVGALLVQQLTDNQYVRQAPFAASI